MDLGVKAREVTLADVFGPREQLVMPAYQRSYSWEDGETEALLSDLLASVRSGQPHFLGAIVLVGPRDSHTTTEVVDGQQRLTTLTMLLSLLRDLEPDVPRKMALHDLVGNVPRPVLGERHVWRLTLNHIDGPFFRDNVQHPGATLTIEDSDVQTESQQRIGDCVVLLREKLSELPEDERRALADFLPAKAIFVRVDVQTRATGYGVFRVLNTRGKQPYSHDIIKTEVLERIDPDQSEADGFARAWAAYEARLSAKGFDDLLRQIRTLYDRSMRGDVLAGFSYLFDRDLDPRTFLETLLPRYVDAQEEISTGQSRLSRPDGTVRKHLNYLRLLDHAGWRAPALKFLVEHPNDDDLSSRFFKALERLAYASQFILTERDTRIRRYRRVVDAIGDAEDLFGPESPLHLNREEKRKLRERLLGRFGSFGQRRAIAIRLNGIVKKGEILKPEDDATVEHILPRNPARQSEWMKTWPKLSERRELCDTVGNFILLPYDVNQEADRLDYKQKLEIFKRPDGSRFALTRDMLNQGDWTPSVVRKRTERLAKTLADEWELNT